jgi:hypothetical protein
MIAQSSKTAGAQGRSETENLEERYPSLNSHGSFHHPRE